MELLTIIIPVFNEEKVLPKALELLSFLKSSEIIFVDSGSSDSSVSLIEDFIGEKSCGWRVVKESFDSPSIGKAVSKGVNLAETEYVLILPVDCFLSINAFKELGYYLKRGFSWGGFEKVYTSKTLLKGLYASLQNVIRTRLFRNLVWTNGFFGKRRLLETNLSTKGFLEDVELSDRLKKESLPIILAEKIEVSDRKYQGRVLKRIFLNLSILFLYRLKLKSVEELRELYQ